MNNQWTLKTWGDGWSGGSEIKDGDDLIVASHCSLYGEQIMREHGAYEKQRECIRELTTVSDRMFYMFADYMPALEYEEMKAALAKAKELL